LEVYVNNANGLFSDAEASAFECRHGISLPEGYRRLLLEIGNGGNGPPFYLLGPLGRGPKSSYQG
jgi:hypothetical protein